VYRAPITIDNIPNLQNSLRAKYDKGEKQ